MRVLNVEDSARDSALIERELRKGFGAVELSRVETPEGFAAALEGPPFDIVIADHSLPRFSSLAALAALRASGRDTPLIVVSGTMGLGFAVEAMRAGARDYLVKADLVRLNAVVDRELRDVGARRLETERHALAAIDRRRSQEALRVSEERYRVLVETSPNGVALIELDFTVIKANRRLASLLGIEDASALEGRRLTDFVAEEDRGRAESDLASCVARGDPMESLVRFRHGEASFDGEISGAVTSGDEAKPALVVIIRDVTEQRRLQARLAQSDRMASVGMLAAGVAHEINNPLTYVLCNLESLAADLPAVEAAVPTPDEPLELQERAREALEGAHRIREIVRDLKVFSRAGSERLEPVALNKVLQGAVNMTHNEVKYRARLVADYGALPPVLANEGRLAQVFLNLLVNAAQAIREGDVERNTISVRTWTEGDSVLAEVRDTGVGMSSDVQKRIFDPFFTTKPAGIGTGLGLAISREIVEAAGGSISVESRPGEGARFLVRLPVGTTPLAPAGRGPIPAAGSGPGPRRGRVLVVDDEAFVRAAVVRLLRAEHDVVEVESGHAAEFVLISDDRFDVILTDLLMPDVSGMDLYERLAASRPDLAARVVFMTGGVFTQRATTFLQGLSNTRIEKPIDSASLRQVVRVLVASRVVG